MNRELITDPAELMSELSAVSNILIEKGKRNALVTGPEIVTMNGLSAIFADKESALSEEVARLLGSSKTSTWQHLKKFEDKYGILTSQQVNRVRPYSPTDLGRVVFAVFEAGAIVAPDQ